MAKNFKENRIFILSNPLSPRISPELAMEIGIDQSILLLQLEYWIATYGEDDRISKSIRDIQKTFTFWSVGTIYNIIKSLHKKKLILYNPTASEFGLNFEGLAKLNSIVLNNCSKLEQNCSGIEQNCSGHEHSSINKSYKKNKKYSLDSLVYKTAEYLAVKILAINPKHKPIIELDIQRWCIETERMYEIDKRTKADVLHVIDWIFGKYDEKQQKWLKEPGGRANSDFRWYKNILSMKKFREKFDRIYPEVTETLSKVSKKEDDDDEKLGAYENPNR